MPNTRKSKPAAKKKAATKAAIATPSAAITVSSKSDKHLIVSHKEKYDFDDKNIEKALKRVDANTKVIRETIEDKMVTRKDIQALATKKDLEAFATKQDLNSAVEKLKKDTVTPEALKNAKDDILDEIKKLRRNL